MRGRGRIAFVDLVPLVATAVLLVCPTVGGAHGVAHEVLETATGVQATYADGTPMEYCDVAVFSPASGDVEFQTGTTDRHGRFAFVPDTFGAWKVTVDDGMGHRVTAEVTVDSLGVVRDGDHDHDVGHLGGALGGLGAIFGLFGIWALWRASNAQRRP